MTNHERQEQPLNRAQVLFRAIEQRVRDGLNRRQADRMNRGSDPFTPEWEAHQELINRLEEHYGRDAVRRNDRV